MDRRPTRAHVTGFTRDCVRALGLAPDPHDLGALAGEFDRRCASFPRVAPVIKTSVTAPTLLSADHDPLAHSHQSGQRDRSYDRLAEPLFERGVLPDMPMTLHRSAEITVGLPREQAIALFTAEGERRWAEGWEPSYPEPARRDGPGAVFTTAHSHHETTWIMVDHRSDGVRYARVTQDVTAGTVAVDVVSCDDHATRVRVTYDLTALSTAGEGWLNAFDVRYDTEIASWATDIAASLSQ